MRLRLTLILTLLSTLILLVACQHKSTSEQQSRQSNPAVAAASPDAPAAPDDGVRRISIEELQAALKEDRAVILDVRGPVEYDLGHIKGARLLPLGEIAKRAGELPRGKLFVTYCACKHEGLSGHGVQELKKQGIEDAAALTGGLDAWKAAGLPVESSSTQ
jgi:rhodanese-related sulfurtransferase